MSIKYLSNQQDILTLCATPGFSKRFLSFTEYNQQTGCLEWVGTIKDNGYGLFHWGVNGQSYSVYAHRLSYLYYVKRIPDGYQIDHICRNRKCVNPIHLEAVTQQVNINRGQGISVKNKQKTHCPQGHVYSGDNLYIDNKGWRKCKICVLNRCKQYRKRKGADGVVSYL